MKQNSALNLLRAIGGLADAMADAGWSKRPQRKHKTPPNPSKTRKIRFSDILRGAFQDIRLEKMKKEKQQ